MDTVLLVTLGILIAMGVGYLRRAFLSFLAQKPEDYAEGGPQFDLRTHLNGPILCEGVIYGPTGRVTSRFIGEFQVEWTGNLGVMKEHFRYEDGTTQNREWHLTLGNDGQIEARAPDVVGIGTGAQKGSAVQLKYRIRLPDQSGGHVLDTVDWMYLAPNGTIVNRSQFRKFGIQVAELVATMRSVSRDKFDRREAA